MMMVMVGMQGMSGREKMMVVLVLMLVLVLELIFGPNRP
jgi:hypothetical protein